MFDILANSYKLQSTRVFILCDRQERCAHRAANASAWARPVVDSWTGPIVAVGAWGPVSASTSDLPRMPAQDLGFGQDAHSSWPERLPRMGAQNGPGRPNNDRNKMKDREVQLLFLSATPSAAGPHSGEEGCVVVAMLC